MKKSIRYRLRVTKTGKIIRRPMGVSHSKSKKSGKQNRNKRKNRSLYSGDSKRILKYVQGKKR